MTDWHSHILPGMDDGAETPEEAIDMLCMSAEQGVKTIYATSHFYADEEDPETFLRRRNAAYQLLKDSYGALRNKPLLPKVLTGAEVYYFPGMASCEELRPMELTGTGMLLVEPPAAPFSRRMLDEIEAIGRNLGLQPVIAHLDRYCRMLGDPTLFDAVGEREILVQVNASFFIHRDWRDFALRMLEEGRIHMMGSDCHNTEDRAPNLGIAAEIIFENNLQEILAKLDYMDYNQSKMR